MPSAIQDGLADRIYEAAFLPEMWPDVLEHVADVAGAASGELLTFSRAGAPIFKASRVSRDGLTEWIGSGLWLECQKPDLYLKQNYPGFLPDTAVMSPEQIEVDTANAFLAKLGLGGQVGSMIPLPTGNIACFTFQKWLKDGPADEAMLSVLDEQRRHLARAALLGSQLELEQVRNIVSALASLGLAAAAISSDRKVLATNELFDKMSAVFRPAALGRLAVADANADGLIQAALSAGEDGVVPVRSIGIPATEERGPMVAHVLPLRRNARDLFTRAHSIMAVTSLNPSSMVPEPSLLSALFDLTPAEARLAASLGQGLGMREATASLDITYKTGRTYLSRVFAKTGVKRQAELVALLRGTYPLG